jgi:hypothetical protein
LPGQSVLPLLWGKGEKTAGWPICLSSYSFAPHCISPHIKQNQEELNRLLTGTVMIRRRKVEVLPQVRMDDSQVLGTGQ